MKKKSFLIVLLVLLVSMCAFACGSPAPFNEYAGFDGTNEYGQMTVDSNMTLDGKLKTAFILRLTFRTTRCSTTPGANSPGIPA